MPCLFFKLVEHPVQDRVVEVVAAQVGIAIGRKHFEDAIADFEDGDIECSAAKVEDGDFFVASVCRGHRQARLLLAQG